MKNTRRNNNDEKASALPTVMILAAAVCWGFIGIFTRSLSGAGLSAVQITAVRNTLAAALLGGYLLIFDRRKLRFALRDIWMFLGTGVVSIMLFNTCYFAALEMAAMSVASILLYTSPFFVMLISAVVFRERLTARKLISLVTAFCGCVLITGALSGDAKAPPLAIALGVCSGLCYGLYSIFGKLALAKYDILTVTFWTFMFAALSITPFAHIGGAARMIASDVRTAAAALLLVLVSTILPFTLYTKGLQKTPSGKAAVLAFAEPAVASLVGVMFFEESLDIAQICGLCLVFAGICVLSSGSE